MYALYIVASVMALALAVPLQFDQIDSPWENYKKSFARNYAGEEDATRKMIFTQNYVRIMKHNVEADLGLHSYWQGVNRFTDMTNEEFRAKLNGLKLSPNRARNGTTFLPPLNMGAPPSTVDWRTKGYVTPVKDQGQCGSCWAFSATGSLEGQHFRKTGKLVSLSEQNLVDCSGAEGNAGCNGGLMDDAFQYIKINHGIDTEACYPYKAEDDDCTFKTACIGATDVGFVDIPSGNEDALLTASATVGPISVAIDASNPSFQSYSSGIYDEPDCSSTQLDHGVLVVGYGSHVGAKAAEKDYWLVKNSWGDSWGIHGYIKMSRNKDNQCGIATMASYPLV